ncbi:MAG: hypothetical protein FWC40_00720, partial [Proteobacteria bacterium]|nr:hypothetical protein [Pseudomonadota bacterium]
MSGLMTLGIDIRTALFASGGEGEETAEIYRREARALYETRPADAAAMLIDAAYANDRDDAPTEIVVRDLMLAMALCPSEVWVFSAARRLMQKHGLSHEVLSLIEHEIDLSVASEYRIALCLEAAQLLWIVLEEADGAHAWIKRGLEIDPSHVGVLYAALWVSMSLGSFAEASDYSDRLAQILGAPAERSVLYALAGGIHAAKGDAVGAHGFFSQAAASDRANLYAHLRLGLMEERLAHLEEAAQSYMQAATLFCGDSCSGEFFSRAGRLCYFAKNLEKSIYYLDEARARLNHPYDLTAMASEVCEWLGNDIRVAELEQQLIDMTSDIDEKVSRYLKLADVFLYRLGDEDRAMDALEAVMALNPKCLTVRQRLAALYEKRGAWRALADLLASGEASHDAIQWRLAEAYWRSDQLSKAIDVLLSSSSVLCRWRLDRAYEASGDSEAHAHFIETWCSSVRDEGMKAGLLTQLVTILVERLDEPELALHYLQQEEGTRVSRDLCLRRMQIFHALGQYDALYRAMTGLAESTKDEAEALMWRMEAAHVCYHCLQDVDGTVKNLKTIHEIAPNYLPAIDMLHHVALCEGKFACVILANQWRDAVWATPAARLETACENAWASLRMGDAEAAMDWYATANRIAPMDRFSLRTYVALLKQSGRWSEAAEVLEASCQRQRDHAFAGTTTLEDETSQALETTDSQCQEFRAMTAMRLDIRSHCLSHPVGIVSERKAAYLAVPSCRTYLDYVLEMLVVESHETVLASLLEANAKLDEDDEVLSLVQWMMAEVMRCIDPSGTKRDKSKKFIMMLKQSLGKPYGGYLRAEILRAYRGCLNDEAAIWLEQYASLTTDKWIATELRREASLRYIWIDEDLDAARRASLAAYRQGGSDWRSLWELERFAAATEDFQAMGVLRERMAQFEDNPKAKLQALKSALAPYIDDDLMDHAVRVAQECLKIDAHTFSALLTLAHVAEDGDDPHSLACIADRLSAASHLADNRLSYGLWAAQIWYGQLGKAEQALASLSHLLSNDPTCMPAILMSERLLESLHRDEALARIYVRAIAALPEGKTQIEILRKHAKLLAFHMHDAAAASLSLVRILKQFPEDIDALTLQAKLLCDQSRWFEAAAAIEQLAKSTTQVEQKREANLKLANILVHHMNEPERAKRIMRRHLNQFPHDMAALRLLYDIAWLDRNWLEAKATLDEICVPDSPIYRWGRIAFTRVAREASWSHDLRTLYERQAIEVVVDSRDDFDQLIEDYAKYGEIPRLLEVTKRELSQIGDTTRQAKYRGCIAALYVANQQHKEALAFLSEVIHDSQHTDWAYLARAQALYCAGQIDSAVAEFRRTLTQNLNLSHAFEPFIEALKKLGDNVALCAALALRDHRRGTPQPSAPRCIHGVPRGFFDIELVGLDRSFIEAQRYLRLMSPSIFPIYALPATKNTSYEPLSP